jgi:hypothetical protein
VGPYRGRKTTGEQVLGKQKKWGELVYKFNTNDQADMYLRTMEAIANFVGVECGRDTRMLAKHRPSLNQGYRGAKMLLQDWWRSTRQNSAREERISRKQSKGICYHSRTVHSQCEEQIGKRIRVRYLGNEWRRSWLVKTVKANDVYIRRGSTSILDTPDCHAASTSTDLFLALALAMAFFTPCSAILTQSYGKSIWQFWLMFA